MTDTVQEAYKGSFYGQPYPEAAYHNTFFLDATRPGTTLSYGGFGNLLYVDPDKKVTAVLFSAWETPNDKAMPWIRAIHAAADHVAATA